MHKAEYSKKDFKKNTLYARMNRITSAIIKSCVTEEKLYKLRKKGPNNTKKRKNCRKFILILNKIINKAKESFDKEQFQAKMKNPKSLWNAIDQKLGKNSKRKKKLYFFINSYMGASSRNRPPSARGAFFA